MRSNFTYSIKHTFMYPCDTTIGNLLKLMIANNKQILDIHGNKSQNMN